MVEPKDPGRILDATFDVLCDVGYDRLTMDAVAERAKASKATIYRHWPGKPELVADAVCACSASAADVADTGSLRTDLLAVVERMAANMAGADGAVMAGLAAAAGREPKLAECLRTIPAGKRPIWQLVVDRAVARGELADAGRRVDALAEVAPAVAFFSTTMLAVPTDAAWQRHVVDDILLPLLGVAAPAS